MMRLIGFLLVLLTTSFQAQAALTDFDRQEISFKNWLAPYNAGFESGKAKWTASGGTLAAVTSGSNLLVGKGSATFDGSSSSQTLTSQTITIEKGYYGKNCEAAITAQVPSGTATHTLQAYDGTNILATASIVSSTAPTQNTVNFPCPSSGTVALRLVTVASDEPLIAIDDAYLGLARNVGSTQLISEWQSYTPTISGLGTGGVASAYGKWRRVGDEVEIAYNWTKDGSGGSGGAIVTTSIPSSLVPDLSKMPNAATTINGEAYSSLTTDLVQAIDAATGAGHFIKRAGSTVFIGVDATANSNYRGSFKVPIVGWTAQTVVMPDAQGWYVDASISGANPSLGTSSVSSYTGIENGSLTMTQNSGSAAVQIGCSSTNAPSGTTCSSGNESLSVAFTPPKSGAYRACVTANHYIDAPAGSINVVSTFQIVETATNAQTILQEGKGKAMSGSVAISGDRREYRSVATCGDFVLSAGAQRMLRLMYETEISGTPDNHYIKADSDSVLGQPDVHWTVFPLSQQQQAILANSVSTTVTNGVRVLTAKVQAVNGSTCTVSEEDGDWLGSTTPIAMGRCTVAINAGVFSASPKCVLTGYATTYTGATQQLTGHLSAVSTSAITFEARYHTGGAGAVGTDDSPFMLMCVGPR